MTKRKRPPVQVRGRVRPSRGWLTEQEEAALKHIRETIRNNNLCILRLRAERAEKKAEIAEFERQKGVYEAQAEEIYQNAGARMAARRRK